MQRWGWAGAGSWVLFPFSWTQWSRDPGRSKCISVCECDGCTWGAVCLSVQLEEDGYSAAVLASCWSGLECRPPLGLERWALQSGQGHRLPPGAPSLLHPRAKGFRGAPLPDPLQLKLLRALQLQRALQGQALR